MWNGQSTNIDDALLPASFRNLQHREWIVFGIPRNLPAVAITAHVAGDVGGDSQAEPDPIEAVQLDAYMYEHSCIKRGCRPHNVEIEFNRC